MKQLLIIFTSCLLIGDQLYAQTTPNPEMVLIEGGSFTMGDSAEKTAHLVTISSFSMGKYEVTVAEYKAFCRATKQSMRGAPSWGWNDKHPIIMINFNDAKTYCNWLSEETGQKYRLPTEAEWEYAARGGNKSKGYTYSGSNDPDEAGWNNDNTWGQTQAVGLKFANELGLYDMSGNVREWCKDWHGAYSSVSQTDPQGASGGTYRVLRGGSWRFAADICRVVYRGYSNPANSDVNYGFRVVLPK